MGELRIQRAIERIEIALSRIDNALDSAPVSIADAAPVAGPSAANPSIDRDKVVGALRALDGLIAELKAAPHG